MKYSILLVVWLFVCSARAYDITLSEYRISPIPKWVESIVVDVSKKENSSPKQAVQYLLDERQVRVYEGQVQRYYRYKQKPIHHSGILEVSQLLIEFDPSYESVELHEVKVYRNGQVLDKLNPEDIKVLQRETSLDEYIVDGQQTLMLIFEDIRLDDVVEYSYSIHGNDPTFGSNIFGAFNLRWPVAVEKTFYQITVPAHQPLYFKSFMTSDEMKAEKIGNVIQYTYASDYSEPVNPESYLPQWYWPYPWMQYSSFDQWAEVVEWALPLYTTPDELSPQLIALANEIDARSASQQERLIHALNFVQDQVRYTGIEIGIGSYKPRPPSLVLQRRYGDCKDKTMLLIALLQHWGIEAYPVLVDTDDGKSLNNMLPSVYDFNHVILMIKLDDKQYWFDPTISGQEGAVDYRYQPDYYYGLVLAKGEQALTKVTINRPWDGVEKEVKQKFFISKSDKRANLSVETRYYGSYADYIREYFATHELDYIEDNYVSYLNEYYKDIAFTQPIKLQLDDDKNIVTVVEEYSIPEIWHYDESDNNYYAYFYQPDLDNLMETPNRLNRHSPFYIGDPQRIKVTTELYLDEVWSIDLDKKTLNNAGFSYQQSIDRNGKQITIDTDLRIHSDAISADELAHYAKDINELNDTYYYLYTDDGGENAAKRWWNKLIQEL